MTRSAAAFAASVLTLVACSGAGNSATVTLGSLAECAVDLATPAGFTPLETFEERYPDHVGIRQGFRDERGRELHAFAGIPGEFGEGFSDAGTLEVAEGVVATLLGGSHGVWVLVWREGDACDPRAVLANGFDRRTFLLELERAGVLPATT